MRREVVHGILWTVACSMLVIWLVAFAAHSLINAEHNPTVYHYVHKFCPATSVGGK